MGICHAAVLGERENIGELNEDEAVRALSDLNVDPVPVRVDDLIGKIHPHALSRRVDENRFQQIHDFLLSQRPLVLVLFSGEATAPKKLHVSVMLSFPVAVYQRAFSGANAENNYALGLTVELRGLLNDRFPGQEDTTNQRVVQGQYDEVNGRALVIFGREWMVYSSP